MRSRWSEELLAWSEGEWRVDAWDIVIIAHEAVKQVGVMQPIAKGCIIGTEPGVAQFAIGLNFLMIGSMNGLFQAFSDQPAFFCATSTRLRMRKKNERFCSRSHHQLKPFPEED
jgi:hypothetical protein